MTVPLTGGQCNDVTQLMLLIAAIPPVRDRPWKRLEAVYCDRGYDHHEYRRQVRAKGITPVIARRGTEHGSGLGYTAGSSNSRSRYCTGPASADPLGDPR